MTLLLRSWVLGSVLLASPYAFGSTITDLCGRFENQTPFPTDGLKLKLTWQRCTVPNTNGGCDRYDRDSATTKITNGNEFCFDRVGFGLFRNESHWFISVLSSDGSEAIAVDTNGALTKDQLRRFVQTLTFYLPPVLQIEIYNPSGQLVSEDELRAAWTNLYVYCRASRGFYGSCLPYHKQKTSIALNPQLIEPRPILWGANGLEAIEVDLHAIDHLRQKIAVAMPAPQTLTVFRYEITPPSVAPTAQNRIDERTAPRP